LTPHAHTKGREDEKEIMKRAVKSSQKKKKKQQQLEKQISAHQ